MFIYSIVGNKLKITCCARTERHKQDQKYAYAYPTAFDDIDIYYQLEATKIQLL
jgi:hypothetical protein